MDNVRTKANSISDQALLLLDDVQNARSRQQIDLFSDIEQYISDSLSLSQVADNASAHPVSNTSPFTVAARLGRSNYEELAKSEALLSALKKLRARPSSASKGIPGSGRVLRSR